MLLKKKDQKRFGVWLVSYNPPVLAAIEVTNAFVAIFQLSELIC